MRDIKFRAWQPAQKRMLYQGDSPMTGAHEEEFAGVLFGKAAYVEEYDFDGDNYNPTYNCENWELMQYTGLKDKNGIDIYEGDIVTHTIGSEIGIVKWWEGSFSVDYSQSLAVGKTYYGINAYKFLEVIGNIYENPELLGEADKLPQKSDKDVKDESGVLKNSPEEES